MTSELCAQACKNIFLAFKYAEYSFDNFDCSFADKDVQIMHGT